MSNVIKGSCVIKTSQNFSQSVFNCLLESNLKPVPRHSKGAPHSTKLMITTCRVRTVLRPQESQRPHIHEQEKSTGHGCLRSWTVLVCIQHAKNKTIFTAVESLGHTQTCTRKHMHVGPVPLNLLSLWFVYIKISIKL